MYERCSLVGQLAFIRQSTGRETMPMKLLLLCFAFPIRKTKWGDSKPHLRAKKRRSSRLIKLALLEPMLAFFEKSVRLEGSI